MDDRSEEETVSGSLVLLVNDQEWTSRSIESILQPRGHAVVRAFTGRQAFELAGKLRPDVILVGFQLSDMRGAEVVKRLRERPSIGSTTPMLILTTSKLTRSARLETLQAGAWDVLRHPVDSEEFVTLLGNFIRVKQSADRLRDEGLADPATGFYNAQGLLRRAREISADAKRLERAVACVALGGDLSTDEDVRAGTDLTRDELELIEALRVVTRESDAVGRLSTGEFVVVAPGADEAGALQLIDRMKRSLDDAGRDEARRAAVEHLRRRLRGGYYATSVVSPADPEELLLRATQALRSAQSEESEGTFTVRAYEA